MPHQVPCKCGKNVKQFKYDVGEFYIEECCEEAGYDYKGHRELIEISSEFTPEEKRILDQFPNAPKPLKPGRGKLRDMKREDLIKLAIEKGHAPSSEITKVQLIDLILG